MIGFQACRLSLYIQYIKSAGHLLGGGGELREIWTLEIWTPDASHINQNKDEGESYCSLFQLPVITCGHLIDFTLSTISFLQSFLLFMLSSHLFLLSSPSLSAIIPSLSAFIPSFLYYHLILLFLISFFLFLLIHPFSFCYRSSLPYTIIPFLSSSIPSYLQYHPSLFPNHPFSFLFSPIFFTIISIVH